MPKGTPNTLAANPTPHNFSQKYLGNIMPPPSCRALNLLMPRPSATDSAIIKACDVFFASGRDCKQWLHGASNSSMNPNSAQKTPHTIAKTIHSFFDIIASPLKRHRFALPHRPRLFSMKPLHMSVNERTDRS
jgi:hypothetical protein